MTTNPQSTTDPCPLPEPLRSLAREICSHCRTGTVSYGHMSQPVEPPHRIDRPMQGSTRWRHRYYGYGYDCEAWVLYELNARAGGVK